MIQRIINKIKRDKDPVSYWREKGVVIGEDCMVNAGVQFGTEPYLIQIGNHVRINTGVHFVTHDGGCWVLRKTSAMIDKEKLDIFGRIIVGSNVHIGTNAIIMPNVHIGNNCIVGCGAVVTHNVPDNSIVGGVPARIIENINDYEQKHKNDFLLTKGLPDQEKRNILKQKFLI